ncbi:MAG: conjugal transfer protein TraF [bacterium]
MKFSIKSVLLVLICFTAGILFAEEDQVFIRGIRPLGMGGAFTAVADDQNAPFYNPAGISQRTSRLLTVFEMPITIGQDFLDLYEFYKDNETELEKFDEQTNEKQAELINKISNDISKLSPFFGIGLPNMVYLSKPSKITWGVGLFGEFKGNFQIRNGVLVPTYSIFGNIDVALISPLSYKLDTIDVPYWKGKSFAVENLAVGCNLKYLNRANINEVQRSVLELEEFDPIMQTGDGWGMDLGAIYPIGRAYTVGMMITDLFGTKISYDREENDNHEVRLARDAVIPPAVNLGLAYRPQDIPFIPMINKRLLITADIRDIFDDKEKIFDETFYKKIHFGAEYPFMFITGRVGLNQGYPTIGVEVSLLALKIGYTYYSDELGLYAGQNPARKNLLNIAVRFGGKGTTDNNKSVKLPASDKLLAEGYKTARLVSSTTY